MAMASDRVEVDTARPFRSVKEAVAVFGERILVGESRSLPSGSAAAIATPHANANAIGIATNAKHEDSSISGCTTALSPNAMAEAEAEAEAEITTAVVPMYSAPSSPPSFGSSRSQNDNDDDEHHGQDGEAGLSVMGSIKKLEDEVAETRKEVARLKKRGNEMEMAVASLNAQLHRGLSRLAEMEAGKAAAARRSIGGDTDVTAATLRSERWGGRYSGEYLPSFSFSHALSLGEIDDELIGGGGGGRGRKAQKVKPIVPLIGDILFSKRKSTRVDKGGDGLYSGDLYSVLG